MIKAYLKDGVITLAPEGRKKAEFTAGAALTTIGEQSSMINPYTFFDDFEESTFQTLVRTELDRLFAKMYEDRVSERITEYNFNMLSQKYQTEQLELEEKIKALKAALAESKQTVEDAKKWIDIVKQYSEPTELTAELLNNMIDKIVVHEAIKYEGGLREQKIEIYYRFVGKID